MIIPTLTVKDLIKELLNCPMGAKIIIPRTHEFTDEGVEYHQRWNGKIHIDDTGKFITFGIDN